jgi:F0F1-type ATP synthase delta subunit
MRAIIKKWELPAYFEPLLLMLIDHQRAGLVTLVLKKIYKIYEKEYALLQVTVSSAHELSSVQTALLTEKFSRMTGHTLHVTYLLDAKLIAGIRLQSSIFLWEHSVRKTLSMLAQKR